MSEAAPAPAAEIAPDFERATKKAHGIALGANVEVYAVDYGATGPGGVRRLFADCRDAPGGAIVTGVVDLHGKGGSMLVCADGTLVDLGRPAAKIRARKL